MEGIATIYDDVNCILRTYLEGPDGNMPDVIKLGRNSKSYAVRWIGDSVDGLFYGGGRCVDPHAMRIDLGSIIGEINHLVQRSGIGIRGRPVTLGIIEATLLQTDLGYVPNISIHRVSKSPFKNFVLAEKLAKRKRLFSEFK